MSFPCSTDAEKWFSKDAHERLEAARECLTCPIWQECGAGAAEREEPTGVWGARDFTSTGGGQQTVIEPKRCRGCGIWMLPRVGEGAARFGQRLHHNAACASRTSAMRRYGRRDVA